MEIQIANTIRTLRIENGISREVLAEAMEVSVQAVSKWENAQSVPEVAMLARLADYFGITLDELFYGMKKENPNEGDAAEIEAIEAADGMSSSEIDRMTADLEREMEKTGKRQGSATLKISSNTHQKSEYEEVLRRQRAK